MQTTPRTPSTSRRARRRRRAVAGLGVAAVLLLATACGDDDNTSTTTTVAEVDTTVDDTEAPDEGDEPDEGGAEERSADELSAELEAMLPDASAIGADYTEAPPEEADESSEETTSAVTAALEESCPEAAALFDPEQDDDRIDREFEADMQRTVTVGFDPTPRNLDEDTIDQAVEAIGSCGPLSFAQGDFDVTLELRTERDDTFGDRGLLLAMDMLMAHPQLAEPVPMRMVSRVFVVDSVSANIDVGSGLDEQTMTPVDGDYDLLDTLAPDLEAGLIELLG